MVKELGLERARVVSTPGVDSTFKGEDRELDAREHKIYRTITGKVLWLAADRVDLLYVAKRLAQRVSAPTVSDLIAKGCPVAVILYEPRGPDTDLKIYVDSDWAGEASRRSTSGGVLTWSGSLVTAWSRTQGPVALSSGEAELYAMAAGACEGPFVATLAGEMDIKMRPVILSDASAALAMVSKTGLSPKTTHVAIKVMFLQELVKEGRVATKKVHTSVNVADLCTKHIKAEVLRKLSGEM